eukprot:1180831-Prorocentrum_minimum.AAC.1
MEHVLSTAEYVRHALTTCTPTPARPPFGHYWPLSPVCEPNFRWRAYVRRSPSFAAYFCYNRRLVGLGDVTSPRRAVGTEETPFSSSSCDSRGILVRSSQDPPSQILAGFSSEPPRILPVRFSRDSRGILVGSSRQPCRILVGSLRDPRGLSGVAARFGRTPVAASAHLRIHFRKPFGARASISRRSGVVCVGCQAARISTAARCDLTAARHEWAHLSRIVRTCSRAHSHLFARGSGAHLGWRAHPCPGTGEPLVCVRRRGLRPTASAAVRRYKPHDPPVP